MTATPLPLRRAAFAFVFVTVLLDMLAIGIVIPVLPKLVLDFVGGDLSLRRQPRRGFGAGAGGSLRQGRLAARDAALSAPGYSRGAVLAARRRLVPRLQLAQTSSRPAPLDRACACGNDAAP